MCTPAEIGRADDDRLVHLLRGGCEAVVAEIDRRYRAALRTHARRLLAGTSHDPEDAVQETLVRAWWALRADARHIRLGAWLHTVLRNWSLDALRSAAGRDVALEDDRAAVRRDVAQEVLAREDLHQLTAAILALPDRQREALVRHAWSGDSHAEIARRLGTTAAASKVLVHRARQHVRANLPAAA